MRHVTNAERIVRIVVVGAFLSASITLGCNWGPTPIRPPSISPSGAAAAAIQQYDTDGDGALSGTELDAVPAIKGADTFYKYDMDSDGKVTADEIAGRIRVWEESQTGLGPPFKCTVMLDEKPLVGATVTFIPEEFLGPAMIPATGKSGPGGAVRAVRIAEADLPDNLTGVSVMQSGLYRVVVTHPTETIPSAYTDVVTTPLGEENFPPDRRIRSATDVTLNISSR